jgi:galactokinase/mevalonate kinase-like predicted kinase
MNGERMDCLLSLPPAGVRAVAGDDRIAFADSDPPGRQLGSGGGTVHLLARACAASGAPSWEAWLADSRKLVVHGSGQSRRLPAYAAEGKPLLPLPRRPDETGQPPDQRLLDLQLQTYHRLFRHAPEGYRVMVACGDVHVRDASSAPAFPDADVLIAGIRASPEEASRHGVLFCAPDGDAALRFILQKPAPDRIRELAAGHRPYLDTGIWLLSERALRLLFARCGRAPDDRDAPTRPYELFDAFALALGSRPAAADPEVNALRAAVLPLPHARFYHFGTNRSVLASAAQLAAPAEDRRAYGHAGAEAAAPVVLHAEAAAALDPGARHIWIENACVPRSWRLLDRHVLTGVPPNDWALDLPAGACLDLLPLDDGCRVAVRAYGFDDEGRGRLGDPATRWLERPLAAWLAARGVAPAEAGLDPASDIHDAPLFPVLAPDAPLLPRLLRWMTAEAPQPDAAAAAAWIAGPRVSAADLLQRADTAARQRRRAARIVAALSAMDAAQWRDAGRHLDLEAAARLIEAHGLTLPPAAPAADPPALADVHDAMLRVRLGELPDERAAFARLRALMIARAHLAPAAPRRAVLDDQIVWGRAPVRLDLAGGWTDTPPYCLEHGGRVVNVAVNLNGQPPVQVFARLAEQPRIALRSIDLGVGETLESYDDIRAPAALGGGFGIARAALRLAGFDPAFHADGGAANLAAQLRRDFGGGIEISMLAAVPKGSGLGTSSILAATLLGVLSDLCGLCWSRADLFERTLVLEQLLTSGGGWQDQVGGVAGGLKLVEAPPGLVQRPVVRWLPAHLLQEAVADRRLLLYYTGITRVAHSILGEIVRGIFLNDAARLRIVGEIGLNADFAVDAIQRQSWPALAEAIRRSWRLNQALDRGTNPPAVQAILDRVAPRLAAAKLLGAGGGGYLLLLAHTPEDGLAVRRELTARPPAPCARFVEVSVSASGLEVTRS